MPSVYEYATEWSEKDLKKDGGNYRTVTGAAIKVDEYSSVLELSDGMRIAFDNILSLE